MAETTDQGTDQRTDQGTDHWKRGALTKKDRSRAALLASAEALFADPSRGWFGTRMEDIASGAGLGLATAYTHFGNKSVLMAQICAPYYQNVSERLDDDLERCSAAEAVVRLVHNMSSFVRQNVGLTAALLTAVREQTDRGANLKSGEQRLFDVAPFSNLMVKALRRAEQSGEFTLGAAEVHDVATYHVNALLLRVFVGPLTETPEELTRLVLSQMLPVLGIAGVDALQTRLAEAVAS